jgi:protein involved in ribonucleotide reduction
MLAVPMQEPRYVSRAQLPQLKVALSELVDKKAMDEPYVVFPRRLGQSAIEHEVSLVRPEPTSEFALI